MKAYIITTMILNLLGAGIALAGVSQGKEVGTNFFAGLVCLGFSFWAIMLLGDLP